MSGNPHFVEIVQAEYCTIPHDRSSEENINSTIFHVIILKHNIETNSYLYIILRGVSLGLFDITSPSARMFYIIYSVCLSYTY